MMVCLLGRGQVNLSLLSLRCAIATPNMDFFHLNNPVGTPRLANQQEHSACKNMSKFSVIS